MKRTLKPLILGSALAASLAAGLDSRAPARFDLVGTAQAIVGAPMTPVSYAGVARRTTRRVVAVEATEASAVAVATAPKAPPPVQPALVAPPPPVATPSAAPAMGAIVATLPQGCKPTAIGGVEYYYCSGVFYRTAFQGPNLVYVVSQP